jgi:hypothetical protein
MAQLDDEHAFEYHYRFEIADDQLRDGNSKFETPKLAVTFYRDAAQKQRIDDLNCVERLSGFHRKLIFNLLSRVPPNHSPLAIAAKYSYVVFKDGGFLFCIDAVSHDLADHNGPLKRTHNNEQSRVVIPAQYLYVDKVSDVKSVIQEYLANLAQVYDAITPRAKNGASNNPYPDEKTWPHYAGFIKDDFQIRRFSQYVEFRGTGKLMRHPLGEFAGFVPIPRFSNSPMTIPVHGIIAGTLATGTAHNRRQATPSIKSALEELTRILWGDGGLTTWIMGQPGAGKEVFAQALHNGTGRVTRLATQITKAKKQATRSKIAKEKAALIRRIGELENLLIDATSMKLSDGLAVQSVASVTLDEFNNRLYTVPEHATHCIVEVIDAMSGSIFLDEFDKPIDPFAISSALLRVLEARQYLKRTYPRGGGRVQETPSKFSNVNWIFAGAFTQVDPRKDVPFDLWSRLKGFIHLRNPVQDDPNYGATLFQYRYVKLVAGILNAEANLQPLMKALTKQPSARAYSEYVACTLLGEKEPLGSNEPFLPSRELEKFALDFQRLLNSKAIFSGDRIDSPRGIFKATDAAFNFLREEVFRGEASPLSTEKKSRATALEDAHKSLRLSRGPA